MFSNSSRIIAAKRSRHTHSHTAHHMWVFPWIVWVVLVLLESRSLPFLIHLLLDVFGKSLTHSHSHTHTGHFKTFTMAELLYQRQTFRVDLWPRPAAGPGTPEWWRPRLVIWGLLDRPCRCAPTQDSRRCTRSVRNIYKYGKMWQ